MKIKQSHGISVLGVLVAVSILAAMGAAMGVLVATNQDIRSQQYYADQSFASAQAGLELVLGLEYNNINPCELIARNLLGDSLLGNSISVNRTSGRIYISGTKGSSSTNLSILDPHPPNNALILLIDTSNAKDASNGAPPKKLTGITFQLQPGCGGPVTITSMVVSWTPPPGGDDDDDDNKVQQIKFDGSNIYSATGSGGKESGEMINTTDVTIADASVHTMDFIRWKEDIQNRLYTIQFNFIDGSTKTVTVDTR